MKTCPHENLRMSVLSSIVYEKEITQESISINGPIKCGSSMQWNIIQPYKGTKF